MGSTDVGSEQAYTGHMHGAIPVVDSFHVVRPRVP